MFGPMNFGKTKEEAQKIAIKTLKDLNVDESLYEKSPFNLSGGQKRKVAIAGILASNPDILILDEPTVGLDPIGKHELLELLKDIHDKTNKTIIIITHDMNVVTKYTKRTIVMNNGEIVYDADTINLFQNYEKLEQYNLDLPYISKIALKLKERKLIDFKNLPLTLDELHKLIQEAKHE